MANNKEVMNILIVRFRQMGDTILATPLISTLRKSFPQARIDLVLNQNIASLFAGHPDINRIIEFSNEERHSTILYINKVWKTMRSTHYDVIIDMRSTVNTMLFALMSPRTRYRIGLDKAYCRIIYNHRIPKCRQGESMISHNLALAKPLEAIAPLVTERHLSLSITKEDTEAMRKYMEAEGIDFSRPVMLVGVTAKLDNKAWDNQRMTQLLDLLIKNYPQVQYIFNYAPGVEQEKAFKIYEQLGKPSQVLFDIKATSMRSLAAMASNISIYFGNEGGARHIVHAMGKPSLVICAPGNSPDTWIPQDDVPAQGISAATYEDITVEMVWQQLQDFIEKVKV